MVFGQKTDIFIGIVFHHQRNSCDTPVCDFYFFFQEINVNPEDFNFSIQVVYVISQVFYIHFEDIYIFLQVFYFFLQNFYILFQDIYVFLQYFYIPLQDIMNKSRLRLKSVKVQQRSYLENVISNAAAWQSYSGEPLYMQGDANPDGVLNLQFVFPEWESYYWNVTQMRIAASRVPLIGGNPYLCIV